MEGDVEGIADRDEKGKPQTLEALFDEHRDRLARMIHFRMDPRLRSRFDPADVIQETFLEALKRYEAYLRSPDMPPFLWLRFLAQQKLLEFHRRHLGAQRRDARREARPQASTVTLAGQIAADWTSASSAAMRRETTARLEEALDKLDPIDREILLMRHYEWLTNAEAARERKMRKSAVSKRCMRALEQIRGVLGDDSV